MANRSLPNFPQKDIDRFWGNVLLTADDTRCWEWQGFATHGYGRFWLDNRLWRSTHLAWLLAKGVLPNNCLCHTCDNRPCINFNHLFDGTVRENMIDSILKGRYQRFHKRGGPHQALSIEQVIEIRRRYAEGGISQRALAREYGVWGSTVRRLIIRESWDYI